MERYLTAEEVLQLQPFSHLSLATFTGWRSERKGPDYTKIGNKCLYRESAIHRWLQEQERKLKPEHPTEVQRTPLPVPSPRRTIRGEYGSRRNKTKRERREEMQAQRNASIKP